MKKNLMVLCVGLLTMALVFPCNAMSSEYICLDVPGNALRAFEKAEQVVIAKIADAGKSKSVEDALKSIDDVCNPMVPDAMIDIFSGNVMEIVSVVMVVEKTYKGNLKPGDKFEISYNICTPALRGRTFLLYLDKPMENRTEYGVSTFCGERSGIVEAAAEDILYLDNISKVKGKTRISGKISRSFGSGSGKDFSGRKIHIRQNDKVWELTTDSNGVFEIYDLPAGDYEIESEAPDKWNISSITSTSESDARNSSRIPNKNTITVALKNGEHASVKIGVTPVNAIRGRLLFSSGQPVTNGYLDAESVDGLAGSTRVMNPNGEFEIIVNREGDCVLVATWQIGFNDYSYYPGSINRDEAKVFTITPGAFFDIEFRIPEQEKTDISVKALYLDGKTNNIKANLKFTPQNVKIKPSEFRNIDSVDGKYNISIPKGVAGKLVGIIDIDNKVFKNCPEKMNPVPDKHTASVTTSSRSNEVLITGKEDGAEDIILKFPIIPYCE